MNVPDESKSLEELEGCQDCGDSEFQSYVVTNSDRLYRLPLREFTDEDLRFMIGQQAGLQYLVPIALKHLHVDLFLEGDCYCGALLATVLRADSRFWIARPELRAEAAQIYQRALSCLADLDDSDRETAKESLNAAYDIFRKAEYFAQHGRA